MYVSASFERQSEMIHGHAATTARRYAYTSYTAADARYAEYQFAATTDTPL